MPLIQAAVVDSYHWMSLGEFVDIFTISQMTLGPIGINAATFAGISFVVLALWNTETLPEDLTIIDPLGVIILAAALVAVRRKIGVIKILAGTGVAGLVLGIIR